MGGLRTMAGLNRRLIPNLLKSLAASHSLGLHHTNAHRDANTRAHAYGEPRRRRRLHNQPTPLGGGPEELWQSVGVRRLSGAGSSRVTAPTPLAGNGTCSAFLLRTPWPGASLLQAMESVEATDEATVMVRMRPMRTFSLPWPISTSGCWTEPGSTRRWR